MTDVEISDIAAMSPDERTALRDQARESVIAGQQAIAEDREAMGRSVNILSDGGMTWEEVVATTRVREAGAAFLTSVESQKKYMESVQRAGHDMSVAVECETQNRLHEQGLSDEQIKDTFEARLAETEAGTRLAIRDQAYTAQNRRAQREPGYVPIMDRIQESYSDSITASPETVGKDEFQGFIATAYPRVDEQDVRLALSLYRDTSARDFDDHKALDPDYPDHRADPNPKDPWPRDVGEMNHLEQKLRMRVSRNKDFAGRDIARELNNERRDIEHQARIDELRKVQNFGGQTVPVAAKNAKFTKKLHATFDEATSFYPDAMVAQAVDRHPDLMVKHSTRRAFFSERSYERASETSDSHWYVEFDLDADPDERYMLYRSATVRGPSDGENSNAYAIHAYEDTPDNRERLQSLIDRNNANRIWGLRTMNSRRKNRRLVLDTIDRGGKTMLVARSERPVKTQTMKARPVITTNGSVATTTHELAHFMESTPEVSIACKRFLYERTAELDQKVYNRSRRHGVEYTKPDGFINEYIGKDYAGSQNTEVFSMGMEALFTDRHRGLSETVGQVTPEGTVEQYKGVTDPEHRNLILGILAGFPRDREPMTLERAREITGRIRERNESARAAAGPRSEKAEEG